MLQIDVLTGPPGCGKSSLMRKEAIAQPGLYLFSMPTTALIDEQAAAFAEEASHLTINPIHFKANGKGKGTIERRLDDARKALEQAGATHAVIMVTHDALMSCDLSAFRDWHARIDEAPNSVHSGTIDIRHSREFYRAEFNLAPIAGSDWSELKLVGPAPKWSDGARDTLSGALVEFRKQASRLHGVFVNISDWDSAKTFDWFSIWSPDSLSDFASVQIAGAAYDTSLGAMAARKWFGGKFTLVPKPVPMHRTGFPNIKVHYFTEGHDGVTTFWETSEGRRCIKLVCDHLETRLTEEDGYWSGNKEVQKLMEHRVAGGPLMPKVAGLNTYRDRTKCAFIYSSKAVKDDAPLYALFGFTAADVMRAREEEDVIQFVMRGAIRNADFAGDYDIYLYSKLQAERVAVRLTASAIGSVQLAMLHFTYQPQGIVVDGLRYCEPGMGPLPLRSSRSVRRRCRVQGLYG